ncbi:MAG: 6-pyruvoyltetrahydropterin/6-carboxytetrahydropterin synthase [Chloroflexota bacterium]|jgi:6-pyruvoyltetrahydropterin/6-carboxytetrahydropterin synthase|nr:6-pyruvoyltetrahydropterin/6-carboxytetrahydropterin synthase [Chloroflexota bacterium]
MYTLKKRFTFEAAHFLPHHDGKCRRLHGHSWEGWVEVEGEQIQVSGPQAGMVVDFGELSRALQPLLDEYLDHYCLNDTLGIESPTSEAVAKWVFDRLVESDVPVSSITIAETCTSICSYRA